MTGGPWLGYSAPSKIGTGFYATDFVDYGLRIGPRHPDNTGAAIYVENGGGTVGLNTLPDDAITLNARVQTGQDVAARFKDGAASSSVGPRIQTYRESATPAAADLIGSYEFFGRDTTDTDTFYARLIGRIDDPTDGSEDGAILVNILKAGSEVTAAVFSGSGLNLSNIPTADPLVAGQVWANSHVLTISAG